MCFGGHVALLDEVHNLDSMWSQRSTYWWRRSGFTRKNLNLDESFDIFFFMTLALSIFGLGDYNLAT